MKMKIIADNPLNRVSRENFMQKCARFYQWRQAYSCIQKRIQKFDKQIEKEKLKLDSKSIFDEFSVEDAVKNIKKESVAFGLQLPREITQSIHNYAVNNFCFEPRYPERFKIESVRRGWLGNERPVFRALVSDLSNCKAIEEITGDSILLKIACSYLGYYPTLVTQHLTWSIASNLDVEEIKKHYPPTNFHYDIAGYNFVTANFYITDVGLESGPHVMIPKSHRNKPLSLLLGAGRQTDETVYKHYGRENQKVIVGQAGFGFFQDSSCIHKLIPPVTQNRLLFQIRYS
ncbi:MAG: hypothetical protein VKK42_18095 [Lyngbya sp.]|nr:hypothetical protein [Lyngbya sp.]